MSDSKNLSEPQPRTIIHPRFDKQKDFGMVVTCADCMGLTEFRIKHTVETWCASGESSGELKVTNNRIHADFGIAQNPGPLLIHVAIYGKGTPASPLKFDVQFVQDSVAFGHVTLCMNFVDGTGLAEGHFPMPDDLPEVAPKLDATPRVTTGQSGGGMMLWRGFRRTAKVRLGEFPEVGQIFKYRVWFGTTRKPKTKNGRVIGYASARDGNSSTVHYGTCLIRIPRAHKIGLLSSSWWKRLVGSEDDRLEIRRLTSLSEEAHWSTLRKRIEAAREEDRHAILYLHGFRTSFDEAALTAAQIGFDLQFHGIMAFFGWPSLGTLKGYWADEATIEATEKQITEYLLGLVNKGGANRVHVIAHSMGNRALLRVIQRITDKVQDQRPSLKFGHIILAAPDVDRELFQQLAIAYKDNATRTTLYVSTRDRAVEASMRLHGAPRVGLTPPITICDGVDTIQVSEIDSSLIGHGYVAAARPLLTDIFTLIKFNAPPDSRMGLRAVKTEDSRKYWEFIG